MDNKTKFLQKIGIDTRFVSIVDDSIFINNLRFSRFSRKKEDVFKKKFPNIEILRSNIFQKICTRASRILAHSINPQDKIFLIKDDNYYNFALFVILEPYTRKYGAKLVYGNKIDDTKSMNIDSIAVPLTLDCEVENILNLMLNGEKIELLSSKKEYNNIKLIYPLINVPRSWINLWLGKEQPEPASDELLKFLDSIIPDVRENLLKSTKFLEKKIEDKNKIKTLSE